MDTSSRPPLKVYAVTGGLAAGKSTLAAALAAEGIPVVDTDELARAAVAPGAPGHAAVVRAFGEEVLAPDGSLDRNRLRRLVLDDPGARSRLEAIVHPEVRDRLERRLEALAARGHRVAVVEVPLLYEAGWEDRFDGVIAVTAPDDVREARLARRHRIPPGEARRWLRAQMPQEEKARRADLVVRNHGDAADLARQARHLAAALKAGGLDETSPGPPGRRSTPRSTR
ncbi:dephospho-CoA kinase [Dissulfurirhabdus thermomarina]|uniref:Dephospho-CoA kinase n=1 Tax=Dissulfurirhabdus thermomarina TaxID=1765737 RepID=A0A6N9TPE9_DISTH|nr:dephospho-CoA kinase [Dissulfurirhabdus thermomarina]NDY43151.1 dephospho-CoA kinase [Dissulfurirhabdus thermomarina]NMX22904.1 dephospho-CoA kinase [Dissulfurirhabdus thermomarina]